MPETHNVHSSSVGSRLSSVGSTAWMDRGRCRGATEFYFAPHAERPEARIRREAKARAICETCTVLKECREYARTNRELGFWGGESESERAEAGFIPTTPVIGLKRIAGNRMETHRKHSNTKSGKIAKPAP